MPKIKTDNPDDKPIEEQAREHNKNDVEEMLTAMGGEPQPKEDEPEEPEEPKVEEPEEPEEPETPEEPEAEQPEGGEEDEPQDPDKDEVIRRLRDQVEELSKKNKEEPEEPEEPKAEEPEPKEVEFEAQEFVSEEEFDEIIQDRSKLNEVLNRVALESANATREAILRQLPGIIDQSTNRQLTMRQSVQKFYSDNPDLQEYGSYVGHLANKVRGEKPDAPMITILNEAGERARKELGLKKEAEKTEEERRKDEEEKDNNDQPAFAKRGSGPRSGGKNDDRSDFAKQADEMLKHTPGR